MPSEFQLEFSGMPLEKTSTLGVRHWDVDKFGRLIGQNKFIWRPGENLAVCEPRIDWQALNTVTWTDPNPFVRIAPRVSTFFFRKDAGPQLPMNADICSGAEPQCECGFYAYYERELSERWGAVGIIRGYGKTTVGRKGFRSMKAEVLALVLRDTNRDQFTFSTSETIKGRPVKKSQLRRNYPDVKLFTDVEHMFSEFPPDNPPLLDPDEDGFWEKEIEW